jgi:hypothetical protein
VRISNMVENQQYGRFFGTPIFRILVQIAEKYFTVYMEFTL